MVKLPGTLSGDLFLAEPMSRLPGALHGFPKELLDQTPENVREFVKNIKLDFRIDMSFLDTPYPVSDLEKLAERSPCPVCKETETIEVLQAQLDKIRDRVTKVDRANGNLRGRVISGEGGRLRFVYEICAGCGITYDPTFASRAGELRKKLAEEMKKIPLDLVADAVRSST